jgi:hypothetical protein
MRCERCEGLMVVGRFLDLLQSGEVWLQAWRCPNCGNVVDEQIRRHKGQRLPLHRGRTEGHSQFPIATNGKLGEKPTCETRLKTNPGCSKRKGNHKR